MRAADFLLETLSHFVKLDAGPPPGVPMHAGDEFEKELTALCQAQYLAPIILNSFDKLSLTPRLSRITLERLRAMAQTVTQNSARILRLGSGVGKSFAESNIPCLFLGEFVAASNLYPEPRLRRIDSVELLVRENDWQGILTLLEEQGFAIPLEARSLSYPGEALDYYQYVSPCVFRDKHRNTMALRFRMQAFGPPDRTEAVWLREGERLPGYEGITIPSIENRLISSVLDWNRAGMTNLLMLVDIGLLLVRRRGEIDWQYAGKMLNENGFYTTFYLTLEYALGLLKMPSMRMLPARPRALRRKIFKTLWYPGADAYGRTGEGRNPLKHFLLEGSRADHKITLLKRFVSPRAIWVSVFFNRPATVWLKIRFVMLLLRGRTRSQST